jgi:hypothetical protein
MKIKKKYEKSIFGMPNASDSNPPPSGSIHTDTVFGAAAAR